MKKLLNTTSLKANIIANFVGNGWTALVSFLFVPIYLKLLGAEAYGLIGIFASLQIVLSLLDSGLSTTLNRELSRLSVLPSLNLKIRNLVKTLGSVYWIVASLAGLIALILSPVLAKNWVHPRQLSQDTITNAFFLLSISIIFQFPIGFYGGGLIGLQKQVKLNVLRVIFATLRNVGGVILLFFISRSIIAFFTWTLFVNIVNALVLRFVLWQSLPEAEKKASFVNAELKEVWRFASGLTIVGVTGVLITQLDSIILSKILLLRDFGYYTLAFTVGSISYMIVGPISQSYFPKFSSLLAAGKIEELKKAYHQGCQLATLFVMPFALFLAIFSKEILFIWTRSITTTDNTWQIATLVALAVALHCLMSIPYLLCLAYSNTKLALYTNIILLVFLIPGIIYSAIHYGGVGGAACWLIVNIVYFFINPVLIHKYFLKGETMRWYWEDTFRPILAAVTILLVCRFTLKWATFDQLTTITLLALIGLIAFGLTFLSSREFVRNERILFYWRNLKKLGK